MHGRGIRAGLHVRQFEVLAIHILTDFRRSIIKGCHKFIFFDAQEAEALLLGRRSEERRFR
jgi:hypothetical protein